MRKLQPAVARKYEFGTHHTQLKVKGKHVDLCSLTLKEADDLVAAGNFPYLIRKEPQPKVSKSKE